MVWTTPGTAVVGQIYTASWYNLQTRDNLREAAPAKVTTLGDIVVATGANTLKRLPALTAADLLKHEVGGLELNIAGVVRGQLIVGNANGALVLLGAPSTGEMLLGKSGAPGLEYSAGPMTNAIVDAGSDDELRATTAAYLKRAAQRFGGLSNLFNRYTSSGTWTKDSGATWVYVEDIGAGAGGSRAFYSRGGMPGHIVRHLYRASDLGGSVTVTVGAGGAGFSTGTGEGNVGGASSFGSLSALGGEGQAAATSTGTFDALYPDIETRRIIPGEGGIAYSNNTDNWQRGSPGEGFSTFTANRTDGADNPNGTGSGGGHGTGTNDAGDGGDPGGGGGAALNSRSARSGNGGRGEVRVWQW